MGNQINKTTKNCKGITSKKSKKGKDIRAMSFPFLFNRKLSKYLCLEFIQWFIEDFGNQAHADGSGDGSFPHTFEAAQAQ